MGVRRALTFLGVTLAVMVFFSGNTAAAHSASDAYLTLTVGPMAPNGAIVIHGQWDIALRDLDFVLRLDDDGNGRLTWGEVRRHQADLERYAYDHLAFARSGTACTIKPGREMVDDHADGAYAAFFFDAICPRGSGKIQLNYSLFFAIDPSHRGIFVMNNGNDVATALLSPANDRINLGF